MEAARTEWTRLTGDEIEWSFRPLAAFNDQPIADIAAAYDLMVIGHPMVPASAEAGWLVPLDRHLPAAELAGLAAAAVGPSHESYSWGGHQWALAVDAACHVSCCRPDLLAEHGLAVPATWDDVFALAADAPGLVALPLLPADAMCALVTIAATLGAPLRLDEPVDRDATALLSRLAASADPRSFELAPPRLLDHMARNDDIVYAPLTFGYGAFSGATRPGSHRLEFGPIPAARRGSVGAVLGGAGIAVSDAGQSVASAIAFATWVCSPEVQAAVILPGGGQPAARAVWNDPSADAQAGGFFSQTRDTLEAATIRPRHPRWPRLQKDLGERVAHGLRTGQHPDDMAASLDTLIASATAAREVSA